MDPKRKAILQMLICAAMWSTGGIFIKLVRWNPFVIAGWRSFIAAGIVLFFLRAGKIRFSFSRRAALNGLFMCLTFFAFIGANKLTTAANAIMLQYTEPVFLIIISAVLFHEKFRREDFLVVIFTTGGIALFFLDRLGPGYLLGNCIAVLSGITAAGMYLSIGSADEETRMGGLLLGHLFTAAVGIPVTFFVSTPVTGTAVSCVLALGVVQLGIPFILLILSNKSCPPLACSLLGAVEPLLNPVWVFLFNGEAPGPFALLGGVIVIVSVTLWCIRKERSSSPAAKTN